jgi:hypothetical protein
VKVSGELRIPAALTSGVEPTELSEWKTVWGAGLAWWPNFYLTRVGLKLLPKFCDVNCVNYLFIVVYNIG